MLPLYYALLIVAIAYTLGLLVILFINTPRRHPGRITAWLLLCTWLLLLGVRYRFLHIDDLLSQNEKILLQLVSAWLIGTVFLLFASNYPRANRLFQRITTFLSGIVLLGFIYYLDLSPQTAFINWHGKLDQLTKVIISSWIIVCGLICLGQLIYQSIRQTGIERLKSKYITVGTLLLLLSVLSELSFFQTDNRYWYLFIPDLLLLTGAATIYFYALTRNRLVDVKVTIRSVSLPALAIITYFYLAKHIYTPLTDILTTSFHITIREARFFIVLLWGLGIYALVRILGYLFDHIIFTRPYDERKVLAQTSMALASVREHKALADILIETFASLFVPRYINLYVTDSKDELILLASSDVISAVPATISRKEPISSFFRGTDSLRLVDEVEHASPGLGTTLQAWGAAAGIPLQVAGSFRGLILLGEKKSGDAYTVDDIRVLDIIGREAAVALENAGHYEALVQTNAGLEARVAERTQELMEADKVKDRFLAIVSHELLTPLTCILSWTEVGLLLDLPPRAVQAFDIIQQNGLRQKRLVHDLLDVSRLIHGKFYINPVPADLWELTLQEIECFYQRAEEKSIAITLVPPATSLPVCVDPVRLQQVISNLLTNALKFTDEGGAVTIAGQRTPTGCRITVTDTGKGIDPEEHAEIFSLFRQGEGGMEAGGLGLGLALAKGIIELHHGDISVSSSGQGAGSTFTIDLPALPAVPVDDAAATLVAVP